MTDQGVVDSIGADDTYLFVFCLVAFVFYEVTNLHHLRLLEGMKSAKISLRSKISKISKILKLRGTREQDPGLSAVSRVLRFLGNGTENWRESEAVKVTRFKTVCPKCETNFVIMMYQSIVFECLFVFISNGKFEK
jgi:phage terminase large subunit-like protein